MKKIIFLFFISLIINGINAQKVVTDAHITGHVVNATTKVHIPYVTIALSATTVAITTDITGHYVLRNLPMGSYQLSAYLLGYQTQIKDVVIEKGKTIEINFELEEDAVLLNNVVVSANKNETNRKETPTIVNVITPKLFENTNSVCMADGLNFQSGLRLENNCQNCGFTQVRINGLEGTYSQILMDSRAINSALAGVYGLEQIPVNMIERVEVIRGGGSALFGSNAVAGTINIITREPTHNSVNISNTTSLINGKTPDVNTSLNASVVSNAGRAGITLFASARQRFPLDYDGDGFTEISKINSKSIGFKAFYRTGYFGKLSVEYHTISEFRRGGNLLELQPSEADIAEQTEHHIHCAGMKYDIRLPNNKHRFEIYTSLQYIDRDSYYGAGKDPNAYGTTQDLATVSGLQYVFNMKKFLFMPAILTTGIEYNYNTLNDESLGYNRIIDQQIHILSYYLQNEWKNEKLSLLIGARLDKHNLIKQLIISPRATIRYSPARWVSLRTGYAHGFRAPQAFDEDLHITAVGGEVSLITLDPDLKTETSNSVNFSVDFNKQWRSHTALTFLIEGFYTSLNNVFVLEEQRRDADENLLLVRTNGSGADVAGVNLECKIIPFRPMEIQLGFTYQQSRYKKAEQWSETVASQRRMFRSPNTYGYLTFIYTPFKRFNINLSGTYTGQMLVQHLAGYISEDREELTPCFWDMSFKLSYDILLKEHVILQVNAGIKNIFNSYQKDFDQGENRDSGYIYGPTLPRTLAFGVKLSI